MAKFVEYLLRSRYMYKLSNSVRCRYYCFGPHLIYEETKGLNDSPVSQQVRLAPVCALKSAAAAKEVATRCLFRLGGDLWLLVWGDPGSAPDNL